MKTGILKQQSEHYYWNFNSVMLVRKKVVTAR